ncbi:hypothetical protein SEA_FORZA_34 [Gordonia phage Forza]|uniref:Uncharacterized protein n=1 Tax=Gordonia phage Forza TaxID=2571247 RepID=A0A650EXY7_9CAUD|nr:hypothetical protein PP303_gp034 [Gordonia phage Forza]QEM41504.1 hypothetical protein SEA_BOOPY_35 [Gordonia phage Boopy]QGT55027.1 hypothetical protein SEA_FORZA_34 [Gordonia phage Forza]UXE04177.1 hypothetical protein SEA_BLUENGOLD_33 [Gordonia phage BlueNGold]WBF03816.1 hypothetical protein SEA_MAREELIH_33 [Gordonia phage Mareelih]
MTKILAEEDVTLDVKVTQEHINKGQQSDCGRCPIALAVLELLGADNYFVSVGATGIALTSKVNGDHHYAMFKMPYEAQKFVFAFDNPHASNRAARAGIRPFEFTATRRTWTKTEVEQW